MERDVMGRDRLPSFFPSGSVMLLGRDGNMEYFGGYPCLNGRELGQAICLHTRTRYPTCTIFVTKKSHGLEIQSRKGSRKCHWIWMDIRNQIVEGVRLTLSKNYLSLSPLSPAGPSSLFLRGRA